MESNTGRKTQKRNGQTKKRTTPPKSRDIARTKDRPMSSQHQEVSLRSNCGSMVSLDSSKYDAKKEETSGLKRVRQHLCNELTADRKLRSKQASNAELDAKISHVTVYRSASKV